MPRDRCQLCDVPTGERFLYRAAVPVHQNLLFDSPAAARGMKRGTLDMRFCPRCGFVFNAAFDPALVEYGPAYENSQDFSPAFVAHLDALVDHLVTMCGVRNGRIVEVGCGKGLFLTKLLAHPENRCEAYGFDPSYRGPERVGRARFVKDFYGPATAIPADVVICRHVIEHLPEPLELLRTVRAGIGESGRTRVFLETPCAAWILRNRVPWDFFYEHCSLFTAESLSLALRRCGFTVIGVRHVFGGQYLWAEAVSAPPPLGTSPDAELRTAPEIATLARQFAAQEQARRQRWHDRLAELTPRGPVYAWGAGAKGVTFCNLADPNGTRLAGVVDLNPAKQGRFLPGSGHVITSPDAAVADSPTAFLVFNPNYLAEVRSAVRRLGSGAEVIDLMQEASPCGS